ncbi:MAG: ImmA/IrrE family metallo-endopeptidase [Planctomycetes bacterium]|nr:ImmA/IrrE family metallo-endopeptidase [Planctomycetota bacterium]
MPAQDPNPDLLGSRLASARKARDITQQAAAEALGCSRPTLIAIEKGTRRAKAEEIVTLARLYGRSVHELVRPGEPTADLQPHLRAVAQRMEADDGQLIEAIASLQRFAEDYAELERIAKMPLKLNYPPEVALPARIDPAVLAEDVAAGERQRLGLGDRPIINLRDVLESEVGLRIIYEDLPSPIAGMFAYAGELGGVIAVNRKHPPKKRRASMLHEYGHLIVERYKPGIDYLSYRGRKPAGERFAEAFAMAFLMPATSVRRRFNEVVSTSNDFTIADLCRLAHFFFVSLEAMTLRLESLRLIPRGTREHLKESNFKVGRAAEMLELSQHPASAERFPRRYRFLAASAYDRGELSEGQLARLLRCDRVSAREIVADCLTTTFVSDDGQVQHTQIDPASSMLSGQS